MSSKLTLNITDPARCVIGLMASVVVIAYALPTFAQTTSSGAMPVSQESCKKILELPLESSSPDMVNQFADCQKRFPTLVVPSDAVVSTNGLKTNTTQPSIQSPTYVPPSNAIAAISPAEAASANAEEEVTPSEATSALTEKLHEPNFFLVNLPPFIVGFAIALCVAVIVSAFTKKRPEKSATRATNEGQNFDSSQTGNQYVQRRIDGKAELEFKQMAASINEIQAKLPDYESLAGNVNQQIENNRALADGVRELASSMKSLHAYDRQLATAEWMNEEDVAKLRKSLPDLSNRVNAALNELIKLVQEHMNASDRLKSGLNQNPGLIEQKSNRTPYQLSEDVVQRLVELRNQNDRLTQENQILKLDLESARNSSIAPLVNGGRSSVSNASSASPPPSAPQLTSSFFQAPETANQSVVEPNVGHADLGEFLGETLSALFKALPPSGGKAVEEELAADFEAAAKSSGEARKLGFANSLSYTFALRSLPSEATIPEDSIEYPLIVAIKRINDRFGLNLATVRARLGEMARSDAYSVSNNPGSYSAPIQITKYAIEDLAENVVLARGNLVA